MSVEQGALHVYTASNMYTVLQYTINQDEHKIRVDELVKRLETDLDNVSVNFWKVECNVLLSKKIKQESRAIAGWTTRCRSKFRYMSKFTAALRSFHCDSMAFKLNKAKITAK